MEKVFSLSNIRFVRDFLPIPSKDIERDFWNGEVLSDIRSMALNGRPIRIFRAGLRANRVLDRLSFGFDEVKLKGNEGFKASLVSSIAGIEVSAPIYLADMSFGSLAGIPNIVEAELADELNIISGTGEGGLHPEVAKHKRIFVQWASARFGVDINTLMAGVGIVIKIGQGAKPGIGGHLPGSKVTNVISMVRRIPPGTDALSPAPHHDIYSIEDLKQRIEALKEATGKPVLVKIAATNYVPYVASGIARMGADGIIIDGHGAGTGATPMVVRDNIGIPIELAIASVDSALRREGLRDRVTVIAAGRISSADDAAKLIALGADAVSLGTALLISMGCIMARTCHRGNCPAGITSRLTEGTKIVDYELAKRGARNFLVAFMKELGLILDYLGIDDVRKLVGRRDLLKGQCISHELAKILGINSDECEGPRLVYEDGQLWSPDYAIYINQLSLRGSPVIVSMGSNGPPEVEKPRKLLDWLRFDGAQVTKPAIDPYRESIDTRVRLMRDRLELSMPVIIKPPLKVSRDNIEILKLLVNVLALAIDLTGIDHIGETGGYLNRVFWDKPVDGLGALVIDYISIKHHIEGFRSLGIPMYVRVKPTVNLDELLSFLSRNYDHVYGVIVNDENSYGENGVFTEAFITNLDIGLRKLGIRYDVDVIVHMDRVRSSGDIVKLLALGSDAVEVGSMLERAIHGYTSLEDFTERSFKLMVGIKKEIALMLGAAGIYRLTSIIGNRELLRALDPKVKALLSIKVAGEM